MHRKTNKTKCGRSGFTIIEVVLVLAIAGLIFLMVFVAFPALQRSQGDTQRQNDIARLSTQINSYKNANKNKVPSGDTAWAKFITDYMKAGDDISQDPDGEDYTINEVACVKGTGEGATDACAQQPASDFATQNHVIKIFTPAKCDGETVRISTGKNNLALTYKREGGGVICVSI